MQNIHQGECNFVCYGLSIKSDRLYIVFVEDGEEREKVKETFFLVRSRKVVFLIFDRENRRKFRDQRWVRLYALRQYRKKRRPFFSFV